MEIVCQFPRIFTPKQMKMLKSPRLCGTYCIISGFLYCEKLFAYERSYREKGLNYKHIRSVATGSTYCHGFIRVFVKNSVLLMMWLQDSVP